MKEIIELEQGSLRLAQNGLNNSCRVDLEGKVACDNIFEGVFHAADDGFFKVDRYVLHLFPFRVCWADAYHNKPIFLSLFAQSGQLFSQLFRRMVLPEIWMNGNEPHFVSKHFSYNFALKSFSEISIFGYFRLYLKSS